MTSEEPPSRDTVGRMPADRSTRIAVVTMIAGLAVLAFLWLSSGDDDTNRSATPGVTAPLAPESTVPTADVEGPLPTEGVVAQGTAANGAEWSLSIGGPSTEVCLTIEVIDDSASRPSVCAGLPDAGSLTPEEAFRPLAHDDERVPPFLFGRMPPTVTEVEVILADGGSLGRVPVARGVGGPFYAVEVTGGSEAIAVFGYNRDGTSVRFDLPRPPAEPG